MADPELVKTTFAGVIDQVINNGTPVVTGILKLEGDQYVAKEVLVVPHSGNSDNEKVMVYLREPVDIKSPDYLRHSVLQDLPLGGGRKDFLLLLRLPRQDVLGGDEFKFQQELPPKTS